MQITLRHLHRRRIGYGRLGDDLVKAFKLNGVMVYDRVEGEDGENVLGTVAGRTNHMMWVSIPTHAIQWLKDQQISIFTMWEATVLPEQMRENLHSFETVLVPSKQNQELFGRYHDNVKFVPLGLDTDIWKYQERPNGAYFNVLTAGSGARKAPDLAAEAFKLAFSRFGPPKPGQLVPRFIHKSPRGAEANVDYPRDSEVVSGYISDEAELELYGRAHMYVGPSRGEGFGLQPLQAMAQGIPTVVSQGHGHSDFTDLCWSAPTKLVKAGEFMMGDAGDWWETDVDALAEQMRWVYDNYDVACHEAAWNSAIVAERYNLKILGKRTLDALGRQNLTPYKGDGSWFKPDHRLYKVVTLRDWKAEIAEKVIIVDKGEEYWFGADVKRVLYDAGVLDPVCIELELNRGKPISEWVDTGMTADQLRHYEKYRDLKRSCQTCGQIIGSGIKASDEIFERLQKEAAERC
jgi:glycosyltransferase involved in cell wall biosynthesis